MVFIIDLSHMQNIKQFADDYICGLYDLFFSCHNVIFETFTDNLLSVGCTYPN